MSRKPDPVFVFSNLATSIDGKIATASRGHFPLGTPADREQMLRLRTECDAVLMGASTLRAFRKACLAGKAETRQPLNVVLSSSLEDLSPRWPFFSDKRIRRVLLTGPRVPSARRRAFEKSCTLIALAPRKPIAAQAISALGALGVRRLLVEGGGSVMWSFVEQDLIDEYHLTLTPRVLGGAEAPTLVDGDGLEPNRVLNLRLAQCRVVGDELYLVYRKTGRRGP